MEEKHYSFFSNRECEYFPCHKQADSDNFNCLFCYCPLYLLGEKCKGDFIYYENGVKDCSACLYPHKRENYEKLTKRYHEIVAALPKPQSEKRAEQSK